jgi:hypothetical protein
MEYELKATIISRATGGAIVSLKGHITTHDIGVSVTGQALHCVATQSQAAFKTTFIKRHALGSSNIAHPIQKLMEMCQFISIWSTVTCFCDPDALDAPR